MGHNLGFAGGKGGVSLPERGDLCHQFALFGGALQGGAHGAQEVGIFDRLGEEVHRAGLDGLHGHGDVPVPGEKHDWHQEAGAGEALWQFQAIELGHRDIEHQTTGCFRAIGFKECFRRGEGLHGEALGLKQPGERLEHSWLIIQEEDGREWRGGGAWCHQ